MVNRLAYAWAIVAMSSSGLWTREEAVVDVAHDPPRRFSHPIRWWLGSMGELNLRGFDRPDAKAVDFQLVVMKHCDLGFDQSSIDHRFDNVAPPRALSTLFRMA
jgi:hypothetical protein